ncbi:endo-1,4-beta-xylanase [Actinomadura sp. HBU206391]|uniref:endo-1,4-beta-xylanase n=1 Tax=Actinomadura sp. HBU206391 TaxID=2731692 RepID=UPI0016507BB1|nr:endo-1,4-beta-xylanase [Actinomadura sp. HBU206391]MBC6458205.1 endo-1,4-beta-xylanase [Actinomadura sp. HBU206391]
MKSRALVTLLATLALIGAAVAPASAHPGRGPENLRRLAHQTGVRIGSAVAVDALADEADYRKVLRREFTSVTAENAMKWESVEPERGRYTWEDADSVVEFARRNHQAVRGHTLVWHNQLPTWLTEGTFTDEELRGILRDHITTQVRRYRGKVRSWDVVNEVVNEDGTLRPSLWLTRLGPGYIADAFRWAHKADPRAKLYVNDYNLEWIGPKSDATLELVKGLKAEGVPVHGVGFQGHFSLQYGFPGDFADNMRRFTALGLETAITEIDVRMQLPVTDEKLATQADYYRQALSACLGVRRCVEFTVWGFTDRHSWVPGWFEGEGAACIFDEALNRKPAYNALLALGRRR